MKRRHGSRTPFVFRVGVARFRQTTVDVILANLISRLLNAENNTVGTQLANTHTRAPSLYYDDDRCVIIIICTASPAGGRPTFRSDRSGRRTPLWGVSAGDGGARARGKHTTQKEAYRAQKLIKYDDGARCGTRYRVYTRGMPVRGGRARSGGTVVGRWGQELAAGRGAGYGTTIYVYIRIAVSVRFPL